MKISVVVPVYGCKKALKELHIRIKKVVESLGLDYELILVNDACPEGSWEIIKEIANDDQKVIAINLSRNFGQYNAIAAGVDISYGDFLVVMDCDLQNKPEDIIKMYEKMTEGYDIVLARRKDRKDSFFRRRGSLFARKILSYLTESKRDPFTCNFGLYKKVVVDSIKGMKEYARAFEKQIDWVGFNTATVDVEHAERENGKSSYTLSKLLKYAFDQMFSYSYKPLELSVFFGAAISISTFAYAFFIFAKAFLVGETVQGWSSMMVSIWFFSGLIILNLGIIGIYIGKILDEVKRRPPYVIKDILNNKEGSESDRQF
ncbi:MAG TPA: glycosyltransferase family 2 protein [bacterium]|nr:glycosyltransferase family 2 protein [bacterium]